MGGANHSMLQLIKELRKEYDVQPLVLAPIAHEEINICTKCDELNIPYISTGFYWFKGTPSIKLAVKFLLNILFFYPIAIYKLRKYQFDIVHSNGSVIDIGVFISKIRRIKHVWHLREFGDLDFSLYPIWGSWYERWVYNKGDRLIAISKHIFDAYSKKIGSHKIQLVYNGIVPKDERFDARHRNNILQFCIVGVVQSAKNQMEALCAISDMVDNGCTNFHLNIIGKGDPLYFEVLKEYVSAHSLNEYVTFWGERDDVPQILSTMDVGLMLSGCEAFGRVTVEYMLQNLAVIVSDTGANPEIVNDGVTGLVYPLGDIKELASRMKLLIENKGVMIDLAAVGKKFVTSHFVSSLNTKAIYNIYSELLL